MQLIEKKILPQYFQAIIDGKKNFELRLGDFECNEGDELLLKEFDPQSNTYTGRDVKKTIKNISKTKDQKFWSEEDVNKYGFQIIGF